MSVDKFGRGLHEHLSKKHLKSAYGLLNITLKSVRYKVFGNKFLYDFSDGLSVYKFPIKEGIINHVFFNNSFFRVKINDQLYKPDKLLNIELKLDDKISIESSILADVFLEIIIKYKILTE